VSAWLAFVLGVIVGALLYVGVGRVRYWLMGRRWRRRFARAPVQASLRLDNLYDWRDTPRDRLEESRRPRRDPPEW
jgi:hypothetical protein